MKKLITWINITSIALIVLGLIHLLQVANPMEIKLQNRFSSYLLLIS